MSYFRIVLNRKKSCFFALYFFYFLSFHPVLVLMPLHRCLFGSDFEKHILLQGLGKECPVMAMPQLSLYIKAVQQIPFASSAGSRGATLSLISPGACSFSAELVWGVIVGDFGKNQELFIRLYTFGKSPKPSKLGAGMSRKLRKVEIALLGVFRDVPYSKNE